MSRTKGFTLIEIIVVLVIIAILATIAVPSYNTYIQQGAAKSAQNNLVSIYNGQKTKYFNTSSYYDSGGASSDLTGINTALGLNISDNNFQYTCTAAGSTFSCTATNSGDSNLYLTVTNNSIILPGGTGCTASPWVAPCNPSCATDVAAYCPN
jgi:type IV pilus assembly protein PilE